jgi:hypothetical protein
MTNVTIVKLSRYAGHVVYLDGKEVGRLVRRGPGRYNLIDHLNHDNVVKLSYSNFFALKSAVNQHYVPREEKTLVEVPVTAPLPASENFPLVKIQAGLYRTQDGRWIVNRDRQDWYYGPNEADGWSDWAGGLKEASQSLQRHLERLERDAARMDALDLHPGDLVACSMGYGHDDDRWTFGPFKSAVIGGRLGTYINLDGVTNSQSLSYVKAVREAAATIKARVEREAAEAELKAWNERRDALAVEAFGDDVDHSLLDDIAAILQKQDGREMLREMAR